MPSHVVNQPWSPDVCQGRDEMSVSAVYARYCQRIKEKNAAESLTRQRFVANRVIENQVEVNGQSLLSFCSNDYLGLAQHHEVMQASIEGVKRYGLGSGSSALISGHSPAHERLEAVFSKVLKREKTLLFNSGYHANLAILTCFANRHAIVIADKACHASMMDGAVLSRATCLRYRHQDSEQAERLLEKYRDHPVILMTESVFSMSGDRTDLKKWSQLADQYQALLVVDDAHGFGVLDTVLTQQAVPCLMVPFGKSLGSMGAVVSGDASLIETLMQTARSYRYSTALPPAVCEASVAALQVMLREPERGSRVRELSAYFVKAALERDLPLISTHATPIKSIAIGDNVLTEQIQARLMQDGFYVSCIRPPTVPAHSARIRISLNYFHTESQIKALLDKLTLYLRMRVDRSCQPEKY